MNKQKTLSAAVKALHLNGNTQIVSKRVLKNGDVEIITETKYFSTTYRNTHTYAASCFRGKKIGPPYKVIIGNIDDRDYPNSEPMKSCVAVVDCITGNWKEEIKYGKPYWGMNLGDDHPIHPLGFDKSAKFIKKHISKGNVLVFCEAGTSRSVAIGIAYYMSTGKTYDEARKEIGRTPGRVHNFSLVNWAHEKGLMPAEEHKKRLEEIV